MTGWLVAGLAGLATALLVVPSDRPRRFAEDPEGVPDTGADGGRDRCPVPEGSSDARSAPTDLADCCDLLAVAAASGCTVIESVAAVGAVSAGPVAAALRRTARDVRSGRRFAEALPTVIERVGPAVRPLVTTLLAASSSGSPIAPAMLRLADAERRRRRRSIEARIRRLPVLLLLPLVAFVLPAFVVLTLVPAGISATRGIAATQDRAAPPSTSRAGFPHRSVGRLPLPAAPTRPTGG